MDYFLKEDIVEYFFEKIKDFTLPSKKNNYKSKLLESNTFLYLVILLLALKIATVFVFVNVPQNIFFADITKSALENFANQTRQSVGLQPLVENAKLDQAAMAKAQNMVQNNYFAHTSPTGLTPWYWFLQAGYNYKYAGENLAIGFFDSQEVYNAWLHSPEHKANILNPNYKEVGTAVLPGFGSNNAIVVVQDFGSQLPAKTIAVKNNNPKTAPVQIKNNTVAITSQTAPAVNVKQKVLSQSTESQIALPSVKKSGINNISEIINYLSYNYSGLLQDVIYGISLVVIGVLLTMIFLNIDNNFRKKLVLRSVLIVVLLSLATVINREFIMAIIPNQIII